MSIYTEMVKVCAEDEIGNWCSDLHVIKKPETTKILDEHKHKQAYTCFTHAVTKEVWYDLVGAYDPYWCKINRAQVFKHLVHGNYTLGISSLVFPDTLCTAEKTKEGIVVSLHDIHTAKKIKLKIINIEHTTFLHFQSSLKMKYEQLLKEITNGTK